MKLRKIVELSPAAIYEASRPAERVNPGLLDSDTEGIAFGLSFGRGIDVARTKTRLGARLVDEVTDDAEGRDESRKGREKVVLVGNRDHVVS